MVNFAGSVNRGYAFSTDQQRRAAAEERAQAEEAQRQIERQRRNTAMGALTDRYGAVAGAPTEYGQLTGIEQRGQRFDNEMEDRDRGLQIEAAQRAAAVVDQMAAQGAPPERIAARLQNMPDAVFGGPERAAEARALALEDPAQASALLAGLAGQAAPGPEYGAADFYEVDGQEVFGRPVQQPDGTMAFEELPFQAAQDRAVQFQDPDFPGILFERDTRTGQVRQVARNPASSRSGGGGGDVAEAQRELGPVQRTYTSAVNEYNNLQGRVQEAIEKTNMTSAGSMATLLDNWFGVNQSAENLEAALQPILANEAFSQIEQMKREAEAAGSRGTGLGQVTEREITLLQNVRDAVVQSQSPQELRANLANLQEQMRISMALITDEYNEFLASEGAVPPSGGQRTGQSGLSPEIEAIMSQYED